MYLEQKKNFVVDFSNLIVLKNKFQIVKSELWTKDIAATLNNFYIFKV